MNTQLQFKHARGFTLIEVLVALIVLSIGVLGVGKLTLSAVKANDSSFMRGQAMNLTYAIVDNMRANRAYDVTGSGTAGCGAGVMPVRSSMVLVSIGCPRFRWMMWPAQGGRTRCC